MRYISPLLSLFFLALLYCSAYADDERLSFEGKVSAQIIRNVSVPFPIIVDRVFVEIGDTVSKDQRLLEYHLEETVERGFQNELLHWGGQIDRNLEQSSLAVEMHDSANRRKLSSELAAKGLGAAEESSLNARRYNLLQKRMNTLKHKDQLAKADFDYRLKELQRYFGQRPEPGKGLPKELFMTSPIDGTVISMSSQARPMGALEGVAFTLAVLNPIQVQIQVHESEITKLHVGQKATVELPMDEKQSFQGKITMLSWQPIDPTIAVPSFYFVWVDVENPNHILKPGYKVMVHVESGNN